MELFCWVLWNNCVIRLRVWFKGLLFWGKLIMISQLSQFVCWFQLSPWCHILIVQSICFWHNWCWYGKIPEKVSKGPVVWVKKKKKKRLSLHSSQVAHAAGAWSPGFYSMKQPRSIGTLPWLPSSISLHFPYNLSGPMYAPG